MNKINDLGDKVRLLREEKGLSRPVFCGDESELSVRQLVRIEKGEFRPTIKTLEYIANRLDIPSYVLMPDYKELPKRYQKSHQNILPSVPATLCPHSQDDEEERIF